MTRITFYSDLSDKTAFLLHLIQSALEKRRRVTVLAETETAARALSDYLWQTKPITFLPNVLAGHGLAEQTPVIVDWQEQHFTQDDILINCATRQPTLFGRFQQLIELVGEAEADKTIARARFRFYRDRGYDIQHIHQRQIALTD